MTRPPLSRKSPVQVGCSTDQSQMCECLREIAQNVVRLRQAALNTVQGDFA
jgi:hypothetical protein